MDRLPSLRKPLKLLEESQDLTMWGITKADQTSQHKQSHLCVDYKSASHPNEPHRHFWFFPTRVCRILLLQTTTVLLYCHLCKALLHYYYMAGCNSDV